VPRSWTSAPDLHLDIDLAGSRGRRVGLERALRDAVHDGRLPAGTVLPSSRALAQDLNISRGTVVEAYAQLVAEGYLHTRPGAVTVVAENGTAAPTEAREPPRLERVRVDLRPGWLDIAATFPRAEWLRAERAVMHTEPDEVFDYSDQRGRPELRAAVASYLGRARGVVTAPDNVVICAGFAHGLSLVARALRLSGEESVAMEDPCNPVHRDIVRAQGLGVSPLPVDDAGAQTQALEALGTQAVVLTPAHQYPTGGTLHPSRRSDVVRWAKAVGGVVIEDDYDGEFRYDRQPVGAVQGLDPEHVVYAGTTSKTLAPGIRVGWLVLPKRLVEPVLEAVRFGIATPSALQQLVLARLMSGGHLDRQLRRLRGGYRARRDALVSALAAALPSLRPAGIAAGLHVLVYLTGIGADEATVRAVAYRHSIGLGYLSPYWHDPAEHDQGILVGYARPAAVAFDDAVRELVEILRIASGTNRSVA